MMKRLFFFFIGMLLLASCGKHPGDDVRQANRQPDIYPDYADVTIPQNIAPLNFLLREEGCEAVEAAVWAGKAGTRNQGTDASEPLFTVSSNSNEVTFPQKKWKQTLASMLKESPQGTTLTVEVTALIGGQWTRFRPFTWTVVADKIDPILTYRLIEPDYEVWSNVELWERNVENFDERTISSYKKVGDRCMNCHTFAQQNPDLSMLYVRGEGGGAFLNNKGSLTKLALKADDMVSGSVYFAFSPSGRYVTFSTNVIIPAFHSMPSKRLEVFDSKSDVYVADLQTRTFLRSPLLCDSMVFETFPTFSPDGKYIYYCAAPAVTLPGDIKQLQYRLCRIGFDEKTGQIGQHTDTLLTAIGQTPEQQLKNSVCHPRISPDGQWLLFTVAHYGTFPIWHPEADLRMMNLRNGELNALSIVNSEKSDTYHSWSSNSRWFVFASKRDDGLFGKPYFCYVDAQGRAHKPFCLPQKSAVRYDNMLKSFNAPELGRGPLPFTDDDVADAMRQKPQAFK